MYSQDTAPYWFWTQWPENYPVEYWQPNTVYSADTVFYYDLYGPCHEHIQTHLQQGRRVIFDARNEHYFHESLRWIFTAFEQHPGQGCVIISGDQPQIIAGVHVIATPYWYWILDQPQYKNFKLDQYQPQRQPQKKFFMTIALERPARDYLYDALGELLDHSIHSYRARGKFLPNDWTTSLGGHWQRYINTDWLEQTGFTLAVETYIDDYARDGFSLTLNDNLFLSEKSYKPMACKHPILMASTQGNLAHLRSQGFETFPELWDESYDDIVDWRKRMDRIVEIVRDFDHRSLDNAVTKEKLLYNSARFFDQSLTSQWLATGIVEPVLEFVNA
jgi:hypothetical protein